MNCELVASAPVKRLDSGLAIRFLHQGRLHPLRYALGLATAVQRLGGQLYSSTAARPLVAGSEGRVETESGGTVRAQAVVLATHQAAHSWLPSRGRLTPQRSYAIAAPVDPTSCADALYWDTRSPRHSVRLHQSGGQWMLIAGGEDQQGGEERASLDRLERWMRDRFTITGLVECRWSGEVLEPADVLGYAGRVATSGNVYVISGESGHGMTHGTLGAMLVRDLIIGRQTHWEDLFDPSREPIPIGERRSSPAPTS